MIMGTRMIRLGVAAMLGLALGHAPAAAQSAPVAIVVHPATNVEDLSFAELRSIFRGERQFWSDGRRVTLLVRAPVAEERRLVLEKIYDMDEDEFREYWIGKMFRAEIAAGPKLVYSADMARDLVGVIPGAITFVPASQVSSDTKVVRIDHLLPGDEGYPLR
jgi:hypothetical protein